MNPLFKMAINLQMSPAILAVGLVSLIGASWTDSLAAHKASVYSVSALTHGMGSQIDIYPSDSFEAAVESLQAGDTLIVHEGTYDDSGRISISVQGTAGAPVLICAADGEAMPLIMRPAGASVQNTINIEGATYLTIKGLEITSNGGDGVKMTENTAFITLEDLLIHDVDVGVNFKGDMHHITVRHSHIYDTGDGGATGEGMYIGCNYGDCVVSDSLVEFNWIHDTFRASQGDGIEVKRGSHSNIIRHNVIYDTHWPCILLYGTEGNPRNLVEGNVMWNCGDSGIQVAADAILRNNIVLDSPANGLNSQDHQGVTPQNLEIVHNTIVGGNPCLRMSNWSNKPGIVFANNAVYCHGDNFAVSALNGVAVSGNVVVPATNKLPSSGYTVGRSALLDLLNAAGKNVYPSTDSALIDAGDPAYLAAWDFNQTIRSGTPDAGAYTWTGALNPGWPVGEGFKQIINTSTERLYLPAAFNSTGRQSNESQEFTPATSVISNEAQRNEKSLSPQPR